MLSPSLSRITNRMRSSITELSFHGIPPPPLYRGKSVTHVSGTFCYLCVEPHILSGRRYGYPPLEDAASPGDVLQIYIVGMKRWVAYARSGPQSRPKEV